MCFFDSENLRAECTRYWMIVAPDLTFGSLQKDGNWSGMIGMVDRGEVDMAVAPIYMTPARKEVVDFTVPLLRDV